jgi:glycosyltransferase involved in cell wall biosynthesis
MRNAGVETLVLRLAKWYHQKGVEARVLLIKASGDLLPELHRVAKVKEFDVDNIFVNPLINSRIKKDPFFTEVEEVFSVFAAGNWIAAQICTILNIPIKIGIYHPDDYKVTNSSYEKELFNRLPDACKLFMNQECLLNTEIIFNRKFNSPIWPLPVINISNSPKVRRPQRSKIISIGRFVSSKIYNLTMIKIVSVLNNEGIEVYFDIYGYGELESEMRKLINDLGLNDKIKIKGELQYKDFEEVMSSAYVFVGCGTSVIEASYFGVPSIVATENSLIAESNGLFCNIIGYNVGERVTNAKTILIKDLITYILSLNNQEYEELGKKHRSIAISKYEINNVCEKFTKFQSVNIDNGQSIDGLIRKAAWQYKKSRANITLRNNIKHLLNFLGWHKYEVTNSYFYTIKQKQ